MITFPNFKINIGLQIIGKRSDGYHDIETLMYPVDIQKDRIEITQSDKAGSFSMNNATFVEDAESNLCMRAFRLLQKEYNLGDVNITLTKNIPVGAGLGGGSSDAAFTLKMLHSLYNLDISREKLYEFAGALGSDVPFFIDNVPAIAKGRGEILKAFPVDLSDHDIAVIKPDFSISTAEAYANVKPSERAMPLEKALALPVADWKHHIYNDFETALSEKYPVLQKIKQVCYEAGASYVSLSGSGSAMYAISPEKLQLKTVLPEGCLVLGS